MHKILARDLGKIKTAVRIQCTDGRPDTRATISTTPQPRPHPRHTAPARPPHSKSGLKRTPNGESRTPNVDSLSTFLANPATVWHLSLGASKVIYGRARR
jgi:hypothetical protein